MVYRALCRFHVLNARNRIERGVPVDDVVRDLLTAIAALRAVKPEADV